MRIASETPLHRAVFWAALLLALAAGAWQAHGAWMAYEADPRLPLWDMARHGWAGVEVLRPLGRGEVWTALARLNRQDSWPFGFSLLLMPFLAAGGAGFVAATLMSTVLFGLTPALMVWAGRETDRAVLGTAAGLLGALLWAASPLPLLFAILVMRETAGAALALAAFALYSRALRRETRRAYGAAGIAVLALLLVKYNYGLLWSVAVTVHQVLRLEPAGRAGLRRWAAAWLWPWRSGRRGRIALAVLLYLIAGCALARVNVGYAVYALLLGGAVALALAWRRDRAGLAARWRALPPAVAALLAAVVLPLWAWFLSPHPIHPKAVFAFLRNRPGGQPGLGALLTYPRALLADYAPAAVPGAVLLGGALLAAVLALRRRERRNGPAGALALLALVGLALTTLHPFKEPRFLFTVAPFVVLLGSLGLAAPLASLARRPTWNALAVLLLPCLGALVIHLTAPAPVRAARLAAGYAAASSDPALGAVLQEIHRQARPGPRTAFLGGANELSEALVRWWLAEQDNPQSEALLAPPNRFAPDLPPERVRQRLRRWLDEERPDRVIALRPFPDSPLLASPDYQAYNAWQLGALAALRAEPDWDVVKRRRFRGQRVEILVLERRI